VPFLKKIWKPLAGAGLAAAAPFTGGTSLAWLGPLLGAGGAALGGWGAGKIAGRQSDAEKAALGGLGATTGIQTDVAKQALGTAGQYQGMATPAMQQSMAFWSRLLGNRQAMSEALAPEIGAIGEQFQGARTSALQTMPRSGARGSILTAMPFQQARQVGELFSRVRPEAAKELYGAGSDAARLGLGALGTAAGAAGGASYSYLGQIALERQRKQQEMDTARSVGAAIFGLLKGIDFGKLFGKRGYVGGMPGDTGTYQGG
jgi:hypothetical protein